MYQLGQSSRELEILELIRAKKFFVGYAVFTRNELRGVRSVVRISISPQQFETRRRAFAGEK